MTRQIIAYENDGIIRTIHLEHTGTFTTTLGKNSNFVMKCPVNWVIQLLAIVISKISASECMKN